MATEQENELERGLQKAFLFMRRKRYDEAEAALAELDAAYPNNADITALRERVAAADRERRAEIDRGHWDTIFRVPSQALLIIALIALFGGIMGVVHAAPEFQRAGWNGVVESRDRNGRLTRYTMCDWALYSGFACVGGVISLGLAAYARSAWED